MSPQKPKGMKARRGQLKPMVPLSHSSFDKLSYDAPQSRQEAPGAPGRPIAGGESLEPRQTASESKGFAGPDRGDPREGKRIQAQRCRGWKTDYFLRGEGSRPRIPCGLWATPGTGYCRYHQPQLQEALRGREYPQLEVAPQGTPVSGDERVGGVEGEGTRR